MKLRLPTAALLGGLVLALSACQIDAHYRPTDLGRVGPVPAAHAMTAQAFAARYNANAAKLDRLYARTGVALTWREMRKDGSTKDRKESGDGKVIFAAPASTVVTVEKLGKWYLWAGSDGKRYWLFDRTQDSLVLSIGRLDGPAARRGFLGLPVRPQDMPALLGLAALELTPEAQLSWCEDPSGHGWYLLEQTNLRLLADPATCQPVRIELTNAAGQAQVVAELSGRVDCGNGGVLCQKAKIYPVGRDARLDLTVDSADANSDKVKPKLFDLDGTLIPTHKPEKTVDLDAM